jgi:hypothetical protein
MNKSTLFRSVLVQISHLDLHQLVPEPSSSSAVVSALIPFPTDPWFEPWWMQTPDFFFTLLFVAQIRCQMGLSLRLFIADSRPARPVVFRRQQDPSHSRCM